jgi:ubiquitin C-terminal hydrolase
MRSQINCEKCNYKSDTFDETFTFNVPLPKGPECNFSEALKQFCSVDHLVKDNKYLCPECKSK